MWRADRQTYIQAEADKQIYIFDEMWKSDNPYIKKFTFHYYWKCIYLHTLLAYQNELKEAPDRPTDIQTIKPS